MEHYRQSPLLLILDNFSLLVRKDPRLSHISLFVEGHRHETSSFLEYVLLKKMNTIGYYLIEHVTFVTVDDTTSNIVNLVTQLGRAGDFMTSCYCLESQIGGIDACTIRTPEIVFIRSVDRGTVILKVQVVHPLIQGPSRIPRALLFQVFIPV